MTSLSCSVKDLQRLLEREAPVPVEIYRETARIDAHLQQVASHI